MQIGKVRDELLEWCGDSCVELYLYIGSFSSFDSKSQIQLSWTDNRPRLPIGAVTKTAAKAN